MRKWSELFVLLWENIQNREAIQRSCVGLQLRSIGTAEGGFLLKSSEIRTLAKGWRRKPTRGAEAAPIVVELESDHIGIFGPAEE